MVAGGPNMLRTVVFTHSHLEAEDIVVRQTEPSWGTYGNTAADVVAGEDAALARVPEGTRASIMEKER
eukprot:2844594-Pyramimonas_sp.AAC.1